MNPIVLVDLSNVAAQQGIDYSLGLLRIAYSLETHGYKVTFIGRRLPIEALVEDVLGVDPFWVGVTTRCDTYPLAIQLVRRIKARAPSVRVVFGGPQATATDVETIKCYPVDVVVRGEGEISAVELSNALRDGTPLGAVRGITLLVDGQVVRTPPAPDLAVQDWGMPLYSHVDLGQYGAHSLIPRVEAGRGCPYACVFCSTSQFWGRKYRLRNPSDVLEEISWLNHNHGFQHFDLVHDNLLGDHRSANAWLQEFAKGNWGFTWQASARIDQFREESALLLLEAGCRSLFFGIETGSPRIQKLIGKNLDLEAVPKAVDLLGQHGFRFTASFIVGFPQETEADIRATAELALNLKRLPHCDCVQIHKLCVLPGTQLSRHYDNLRFDGRISDQAATSLTEEDIVTIKENPRVFSQFFSLAVESVPAEDIELIAHYGNYAINVYPKTLSHLLGGSGLDIVTVLRRLQDNGFSPEVPYSLPRALEKLSATVSPKTHLCLRMERTIEELQRASLEDRSSDPPGAKNGANVCLSHLVKVCKDEASLPVLIWAIRGTPVVQYMKLDPIDLCIVEVSQLPTSRAEITMKVAERLPVPETTIGKRIQKLVASSILREVTKTSAETV